jgi:hypothetical protein
MQVVPATSKGMNFGDISHIVPNFNAGVKYMRFMLRRVPLAYTQEHRAVDRP